MGQHLGEPPKTVRHIPTPEEIQQKLAKDIEVQRDRMRDRIINAINDTKVFPLEIKSEIGKYVHGVLDEFRAAGWKISEARSGNTIFESTWIFR